MERSRTDARHRPGAGGLAAFGSLAAFSGAQGPAAWRPLAAFGSLTALAALKWPVGGLWSSVAAFSGL